MRFLCRVVRLHDSESSYSMYSVCVCDLICVRLTQYLNAKLFNKQLLNFYVWHWFAGIR